MAYIIKELEEIAWKMLDDVYFVSDLDPSIVYCLMTASATQRRRRKTTQGLHL